MSFLKRTHRSPGDVLPSGTRDRRSVCRYSVVQDSAWLGWWEGPVYQSTPARIIDISLRGARLTVETFPPKDRPVWFRTPDESADDVGVEVNMIGTRKRVFGPREVRIAFRKVLPYETFKGVVYGPDSFRGAAPPRWLPADSEDSDWW